ncbi:putative pumilio10 [Sesamum angolense]|uniref:Pumilio10 n=1 Tax=Sesamum angolense TaxID=2727404 RepID=A0AAE2C1C9_9LAMI|nr:putative pumilio10 [Sesamum angolense]
MGSYMQPQDYAVNLDLLSVNGVSDYNLGSVRSTVLAEEVGGRSPAEIELIFAEIKDHVDDSVASLLVIGDELNLVPICLDNHGSRAMLKLLEHLRTREQRSLLMSVLRRIVVPLTRNTNGHNVIQHCFKLFSTEDNKHILNVVAENCLSIATDKNGCCILQQCLAHSHGQARDCLMAKITANALVLSQDPYGNYVVQYIVGLKIPHVAAKLVAKLAGNYVLLSINKYGSNVVEKCLRELDHHLSLPIVEEIINSPYFLMVLQDPYGNYVAQSALKICKGKLAIK